MKRGAIVGVFLPANSHFSVLGSSPPGQSVCYSSSNGPNVDSMLACEDQVSATVQVEASISELKAILS